ncbi:hypothetical protein DFH94DRAFT_195514 [Russula ochroleuca]|uniref:Uncharacterized protein n=1 Tax=Russula ochroleuca TaxID=152965 RepID=A0A9P5MQW3_9AGAM|nr:hypothetical protein DFH94DRAFT_195514 [Russula ochroleuca]
MTMPEPTPKKHKGKKKAQQDKFEVVISPPNARAGATVNTTTPAAHVASQGSSASAPAASDHDDDGDDVESGDFGDFDYDAVKADDGVELWLVRAPSTVKARNLRGLEINASRKGLVGDLLRKGTAYDLWALDPATVSRRGDDDDDDGLGLGGAASLSDAQVGVGAEELNGLSVLLPCKRKGGQLYHVQKPIARHLVVAARPAKPTRPDAAYEAPKREAYPDEVLTHRFRPYGDPGDLPLEDHMDVEMVEASPKEKERPKRRGGETGSSKKKKAKLVPS